MQQLEFPDNFVWGTATASYQVEGAGHEGGRSESIWDTFARVPGNVYAGENGEIACDQYHRYAEDIALMSELGFQSYRFSIAWPRILPEGTGRINQEGIAYYRSLCEELHKRELRACATLYHWDLPQCLQDKGGWADRSIVDAFTEYAKVCFTELGDLVDQWITINEPFCITYLGYLWGKHAPGIKNINLTVRAIHHVNLGHGAAVKAYRETGLKAPIGTTLNLSTARPATSSKADIRAALIARAVESEVFLYPLLGKGYPNLAVKELGVDFPVQNGDLETIAEKIDFIGVNYYTETAVGQDKKALFKYSGRPTWHDTTDMGWPIVPGGLERLLKWVHEVSNGLPIYITENGYASQDVLDADGRVRDRERIEYLKHHLEVCANLIKQGVNLKGYYAWSFLDNFEWTFGYTKRFGIVYVDYQTQKRTVKDSAYFFRDVIAGYADW
ncbi:MAG: beta-glucosidase [Treponema sp.]|jgi:beta-glucosidase|nr:beta-glucosidase [Treponema sp.]